MKESDLQKTSKQREKPIPLLTVQFVVHPIAPLGSQQTLEHCPEQKGVDACTQMGPELVPVRETPRPGTGGLPDVRLLGQITLSFIP